MAIFIDVNVPIYASGRAHPLKDASLDVLRWVATYPASFLTSAEVLQELLHYCMARRVWPDSIAAYRTFAALMRDKIEAVLPRDVDTAAELGLRFGRLSSRDLVHLAVMRRLGVTEIVSADRGFDTVEDVERLDPARLPEWRERVLAGG